MPIVLDLLKRQAAAAMPAARGDYWESDWQSASRDSLLARAQQTEAIQSALLSVYGPAAEEAEPLREIFRPLEPVYPFLAPAEQRAVAQFRLKRPVGMVGGPMPMSAGMPMPARAGLALPPGLPGMPAAGGSIMPASHAEFMASLPGELSDSSALEFALRESPLAARLRAARADLTEQEFRTLFTAMADAERNRVPLPLDPAGGKVPRSKVLKVVSQGDPAWAGLQAAAARSSVPEPQLWAVYEVVRQTNESLAALANPKGSLANPSPAATPDRPERVVAIMQERRRRIEQLVGLEQAAVLLEGLNESYRTFALRAAPMGAPNTPAR